ncbi:THTR-like protein [Mya arenaria]|uniref:THTR-like protein n=1 Tax=Mya arenaria TaxID=6604 RepID=A0ABY7G4X8_MYAAR|nr:THTR-like protein [Mya arenaria]
MGAFLLTVCENCACKVEKLWKCGEAIHWFPVYTQLVFEPHSQVITFHLVDYVQGLGIWPDTHVIAYDRSLPQAAYRTWWMLRLYGHRNVSVLDGGLRKWLEDGYDVTTDEPEIERSDFVAKLDKNLLRSYDDVIRNFETRREQIVDARGEQSQNGSWSEFSLRAPEEFKHTPKTYKSELKSETGECVVAEK